MRYILIYFTLILSSVSLFAQDNRTPVFIGEEKYFENYFYKVFVNHQKELEKTCNTSIGLVEFSIDKTGEVSSLFIPPTYPDEVMKIIETLIRESKWAPVKKSMGKNGNLPVLLPLFISIESGCKSGDFKLNALDKDFREMLPKTNDRTPLKCYVLKPIAYVVPAGFQDINPKR